MPPIEVYKAEPVRNVLRPDARLLLLLRQAEQFKQRSPALLTYLAAPALPQYLAEPVEARP